jgi:hypothetical protein
MAVDATMSEEARSIRPGFAPSSQGKTAFSPEADPASAASSSAGAPASLFRSIFDQENSLYARTSATAAAANTHRIMVSTVAMEITTVRAATSV